MDADAGISESRNKTVAAFLLVTRFAGSRM